MKSIINASACVIALSLSCFSNASLAQSVCQSAGSDPDGDGFGWENGATCIARASTATSGGTPVCSAAAIDFDGDGWAFENGRSCRVSANSGGTTVPSAAAASGTPVCSASVIDFDGDGWAFENGASCTVASGSNTASSGASASAAGALAGVPTCSAAVVDFDGDGWAFENGNSCLVGGAAGNTSSGSSTQQSGSVPAGISFNNSTLRRVRGSGDNWDQTWAADNSVITAMDDGDWLNTGSNYHSRLYRIFGDANNFSRSEINNYPNYSTRDDGWFAYGMLSVKGVLYSLVSKTQGVNWSVGPFRGMKMLEFLKTSWVIEVHGNTSVAGMVIRQPGVAT